MAAGSTYTPIATTTLGSAAASYTFSSIAGTYTDLVLVIGNLKASVAGNTMYCKLNADSGSNYSYTVLNGNGSTASSARSSNSTAGLFVGGWVNGGSSTNPATVILQLQNYANTTTYKTSLTRYSEASNEVNTGVSLWRSTSAITSLQLYFSGTNMASGTMLTLYGIAAA